MTDRTLREKAAKLAEINSQIATLEEQADQLKASITAEMEARAVDELKAGTVLIRWKEVHNPFALIPSCSERPTAACTRSMRSPAPPNASPLYPHRERPHTTACKQKVWSRRTSIRWEGDTSALKPLSGLS